MTIRVVAADDHPLVLRGIEMVFRDDGGFELVAACSDDESLLPAVLRTRPDVVLLNLHMPKAGTMAVLREMRSRLPLTPVVLLATSITDDEVIEALGFGVKGIILKEMATRLLLECIRKVHAGDDWLEKASTARVVEMMLRREEAAQHFATILTPREIEVLRLIAGRLNNGAIASRLSIAPGTVKVHVHSLLGKLRVERRGELVRIATRRGLV